MKKNYTVQSIGAVAGERLLTSKLDQPLHPLHQALLPAWSPTLVQDVRPAPTYRFGPSLQDATIAARWEEYEASYRRQQRLKTFWTAALSDVLVEPNMLFVFGRDYLLRETVKSASALQKVYPDLRSASIEAALKDKTLPLQIDLQSQSSTVVEEAFLVGHGLFRNYFNWTIRYACKFPFVDFFPENFPIVLPANVRKYISYTVDLFGIASDRIIWLSEPMRFKTLHLISPLATGRYNLSPVMALNMSRASQSLAPSGRSRRRLYIPRHNVHFRRVVNEPELIDRLTAIGFEVFDNELHTVAEQISAFRDSDIVVSAHGAGLSNIAYCRPDTLIMEIIPEGYDQGVTSYRSLADLFSLRYLPLFAREFTPDPRGNGCNSDIEVDVPTVLETLASNGV